MSLSSHSWFDLAECCEFGIDERTHPEYHILLYRWWTRYEHGDLDVQRGIVNFARMKLAGGTDEGNISTDAQLAVLCVRIGLSFSWMREQARATTDRLVERHMLLASAVPSHREYIYAGASSEPILVEAAAQLMHLNRAMHGIPAVLLEWCNNGLIPKGELGELIARLLLTKAHDQAIQNRFTLPKPNVPFYSEAISLPDFLKALLGEKNAKLVLEATPDNLESDTTLAESPLGKAKLNFTHWCKAEDKSVLTQEAAWIGLGRHAAWQCYDHQADVDLITPLMLGDGKTLGRFQVSAILWQIKNHNKRQNVHIDAERMRFFTTRSTEEHAAPRPYITVVLSLDTISQTANRKRNTPAQSEGFLSPGIRASSRTAKAKHPRYAFSINGCSPSVYPEIIEAGEENTYQNILATDTYRSEHGRDDDESQEALARMKISWKSGNGAMGSYLHVKQEGASPLDGLPSAIGPKVESVEVHRFSVKGDAEENEVSSGDEGGEDEGSMGIA